MDGGVDPELKAHITNLVSALGGPDITQIDRPYKLGDDALACLRDLKQWIKGYDERLNKYDVARAISETSLLYFDLFEILTRWEIDHEKAAGQGTARQKHMDRIALACLELLVPLTWPIQLKKDTATANQYKHYNHLVRAREKCKRAALSHPLKRVLRSIIRIAIPTLKMPANERTSRDEGILKLTIYFFRNLLSIEPQGLQDTADELSRASTITAFNDQGVLDFFKMLASETGSIVFQQDTAVMECIFYMCRGLDASDFFYVPERAGNGGQFSEKSHSDLNSLLNQEKDLRKKIVLNSSTRHSRFGTMVSMIGDDDVRYSVTGSAALTSSSDGLHKLDANKKWRKPKRRLKDSGGSWDMDVPLTAEVRGIMTGFTEDFLDSGFNSLFDMIRKSIERDERRLLEIHRMQYLYLIGWFLDAERKRREKAKFNAANNGDSESAENDYGLVASALNQHTFVIVMKLMRESLEKGEMHDMEVVYASMICFTQILLVVRDMESSPSIDDQDVADNMKARLFYEEYSLDVLAQMPKHTSSESDSFLRATIEMTHVVLKMLESYSKQHTSIYVKSKRKSKKKLAADVNEDVNEDYEDAEEEADRVTRERKFEFSKFENRFINEHTMDAYKRFLALFQELDYREIMWCFNFFHRVFVKKSVHAFLFSLDFMQLLRTIVSSKDGLPREHAARKPVEEFLRYYMKKLTESLKVAPSLYVELLFQKMPDTVFYLDHGYEQEKPDKKSRVAVWEFKDDSLPMEQKFAITIATLLDEDKMSLVEWVTERTNDIFENRIPDIDISLLKENEENEDAVRAIRRDGKFRLLLTLIGYAIPQSETVSPTLPGSVTTEHLEESLKFLKRYMFEKMTLDEADKVAADYLQRHRVSKKDKQDDSNESEDDTIPGEMDGFLVQDESEDDGDDKFDDSRFAIPEDERLAKLLAKKGQKSKDSSRSSKRKKKTESEQQPKKRRNATDRAAKEAEKIQQYKSSAFVHDSDDEMDVEEEKAFFENERKIREAVLAQMQTPQSQLLRLNDDPVRESVKEVESVREEAGMVEESGQEPELQKIDDQDSQSEIEISRTESPSDPEDDELATEKAEEHPAERNRRKRTNFIMESDEE
uniref:Topoisomerase 1-associated factor 1 n=1 Tax=Blastobotrys adeninivorans TaxID=409370 RepID=A0A060TAB9_BLAAD